MLTTIMKTRNPKYETSATSDALLQEIELQKRIESGVKVVVYLT